MANLVSNLFCGVINTNLKIRHDCEPRRNEAIVKTIEWKILSVKSIQFTFDGY
jgi:hypothetical protein